MCFFGESRIKHCSVASHVVQCSPNLCKAWGEMYTDSCGALEQKRLYGRQKHHPRSILRIGHSRLDRQPSCRSSVAHGMRPKLSIFGAPKLGGPFFSEPLAEAPILTK